MKGLFFIYLSLMVILIGGCGKIKKDDMPSDLEVTKQELNDKKEILISAVEAYIRGIKEKDFSIIPYADNATKRGPFGKKGMNVQLKGKEELFNDWWKPMMLRPDSKEIVFKLTDYYFNESLTSIFAESVVTDYNAEPPATVYVAERFTLNEAGEIIDQINHIDVRDVLTPGWYENN